MENRKHIFSIPDNAIEPLAKLSRLKSDDYYVILSEDLNGWCDVALYSEKYQNIALFQITKDRLSRKYCLNER